MKKAVIIVTSLFFTLIMQAQDRTQPKPGPAPKININKPETFKLQNGLTVMVVENHKLPRVSFSLSTDNTPYAEGTKKGVDNLTSALAGNGTLKTPKDKFNEEIDFLGAEINFYSSGASASGLSKYAKRILELMAEGSLSPNFTQEELDKEKEKLIEGLKTDEKNVAAVASRVENVLAFGLNHPNGEYISEQTIKNVTLEDVKLNYNSYFVPENAYLVVIGDVKFKEIKTLVENLFNSWPKATAPKLTYSDPKNVQFTQINFVDMLNAVQSEISVVNITNLKLSDADYFPVIVMNQVLGGDFNSYLNMNLREAHGWTYGARSGIGANKYSAVKFKANSQVRNAVTDSAVVEFLKEIKRIRTELVDAENLKNVKAGYVGKFVMQIEKPQTIAQYALNIQKEGLPADFYENYIKNINAVTAEDVMRVANKYIQADNLRIVITGKASETLIGLESLKIPMFFFDKYGNPVEKPVVSKPIPEGVTPKMIFDNYIKAVGGEKAIAKVKTVLTLAKGSIQGTELEMITKATSSNKFSTELKGMGMTFMKQVINEKEGYMTVQGQKKPIEGQDLKEMQSQAHPFFELNLMKNPNAKLVAVESINGNDAYAVQVERTTLYYDVKSGYRVCAKMESEVNGQKNTQVIFYDNYIDIKGLKFPYTMKMDMQGQELEFATTDVKINEGVQDSDFQ